MFLQYCDGGTDFVMLALCSVHICILWFCRSWVWNQKSIPFCGCRFKKPPPLHCQDLFWESLLGRGFVFSGFCKTWHWCDFLGFCIFFFINHENSTSRCEGFVKIPASCVKMSSRARVRKGQQKPWLCLTVVQGSSLQLL